MKSISSFMKHDHIIEEALKWLYEDGAKAAHISGPTGTGKTNIAFAIIEGWKRFGGKALFSRCEENQRGTAYEALRKLNDFQSLSPHIETGAKEGLRIAEKLIGSSGIINKIYDEYSKSKIDRYIEDSKFQITDTEASIIHEIKNRVNSNKFIIIIDDSQHLDDSSLTLIKKIKKNFEIYSGLDFFKNARFIFISTTSNEINPVVESIKAQADNKWRTRYCTVSEVPEVLRILGFKKELREENYKKLHGLTSGHLKLLNEVASYMNKKEENIDFILTAENNIDLAKIVVESQFVNENPTSESEVNLTLKCAATIGESLNYKELLCLAANLIKDTSFCIRKAEKMLLLNRNKGKIEFSHSCIHNYFSSIQVFNSKDLHLKFSECLRAINPADYGGRATHLELAGKKSEAEDLWIMEWLKILRSNTSVDYKLLPNKILSQEKLSLYFLLAKAIELYHNGEFPRMRGHLEEIDVHNSHLLCFERDYLLALSLALIKIKHTRSKAFSIVNSLACKVTDEFELKARISLLNIYLLAHQGLSEEALALEGTLIEKIEKDYSNQEFGINLLNIMYRKCEQLYPTEVAIAKLKQARNYWQGGTPGVLPKYPQEYYRTSNNLIASLIYLNRVQEAEETARELKAGAFYKEYLIQRPEYIENNFLLSCFINKTMTPKECLKAQRKIVESPRAEYDNLISSSNMSIYAAYSNELEISFKLLEACWKRVNEIPDFEVFFRYLIGSNLFTLSQFANRNTQISYEKIQSLTQEVDPEGVGVETYRMPFLQGKANSDTSIHNIEEWDLTPINSHGFLGPSWSFWGRRLMLSGIHSWIDI